MPGSSAAMFIFCARRSTICHAKLRRLSPGCAGFTTEERLLRLVRSCQFDCGVAASLGAGGSVAGATCICAGSPVCKGWLARTGFDAA